MSQTNIYFGFWTNFNRGTVLGSTLTLTSRDGVLFIAFLALFVRLAGSRLWNIFRYIAHQLRSKSGPQDGLYHQQQALLRNQSSNTDILWGLTQLGWAWKSKARGGIFRQLPLALLALIHIITLTLAGLFSSRVATASTSETLLASDSDCGFLKFPTKYNWSAFDAETLNHYSAVQLERKHGYQESSTYVKACYGKPESSSSLSCSNYVRNAITPSIQYNTTCPFTDNFCTYGHSSSITLDSGMVDSLSHLGLNTAPNNRLGYRTQLICAPLNTENYHTAWAPSTTTVFPGDRMRYYYYGPTLGTVFGEQLNATFAVSNYSISLTNRAYKLAVSQAYAGGSTYDNFNPISGLHQTDGDVYLIFLMNMAQFLGPVQDPWYYSNRTWVNPFTGTSQLYFAADPVTGLGCKQQHQLCNGATCTQMTGLVALYNSIVPTDKNILGLSAEQKALAYHIFNGTLMQNTIGAVLNDLDNQALLAQDQVEGTSVLSTALPPYQWVMEVSNWMNIVLASMQRLAVSYATDSVSSDAKNYLVRPENDLQRQLCGAQLIRSSTAAGVSFSVLWTSLILIVGVIVIILDFSLSSAVGWIQKKSRKGLDRRAEWILNNTLQIQRVAFEGDRQGNWDRKEASVPTTQRGEMLSIVGMSDGVARRSTYESERASYGYSPMEKNGPGVSVTNSSPYEYNRVQ